MVAVVGGILVHDYRETVAANGLPEQSAIRILRAAGVRNARIALAGSLLLTGNQYSFYDTGLTNYVQLVAQHGRDHSVALYTDCRAFVRAIASGRYDYIVSSAGTGVNLPASWLHSDPAVRVLEGNPRARVSTLKIVGPLDPSVCDRSRTS
jgi:hypothetical protein